MDKLIITIDGPAGVGKSTVARMLAARLEIPYLDTGAMYRAVTVAAIQKKTDLENVDLLLKVMDQTEFGFDLDGQDLTVRIDGDNITELIRDPDVTEQVRYIACQPALRGRLVKMQQEFAAQYGSVVTEGRDQGTVAFADADFKFYLEAAPAERAIRRQKDLHAQGKTMELETLKQKIIDRDASDYNRPVGPLKPAEDAIKIDTTNISAEQVVEKMLEIIRKK